ncbi:UNVERIFIED_CONTAM: homoserine dehydrogenase [Williamsia faeni]
MRVLPIAVLGYGPVARAFINQIGAHREEYRARHDVDLSVVAVRTHRSQVVGSGEVPPRSDWAELTDLADLLGTVEAKVVVQAVPSTDVVATQAVEDALMAIRCGAHLVTATTSTLLHGWRELEQLAIDFGCAVRISGAVGAMLPAADLARSLGQGISVTSVSGCLNATATYVLDQMSEGVTLDLATTTARQTGVSDNDPTADLSGHDVATQLRILTGLLWARDPAETEVILEPITPEIERSVFRAGRRGQRLRQVAVADHDIPDLVTVSLRVVPAESKLGLLRWPDKAAIFDCGDFGSITVSGGDSSPAGVAQSMIKDTLSLVHDATPGLR